MDRKSGTLVEVMERLKVHVRTLREVLDGTHGMPKSGTVESPEREPQSIENLLSSIRGDMEQATEDLQGLQERLQQVLAELA